MTYLLTVDIFILEPMFYSVVFQVDTVHSLFKQHQYNPPVFKNQPPVAGAIAWERSLFNRIKHTIMRFHSMEDMMNSEYGKAVSICWNANVLKLQQSIKVKSGLLCSYVR